MAAARFSRIHKIARKKIVLPMSSDQTATADCAHRCEIHQVKSYTKTIEDILWILKDLHDQKFGILDATSTARFSKYTQFSVREMRRRNMTGLRENLRIRCRKSDPMTVP